MGGQRGHRLVLGVLRATPCSASDPSGLGNWGIALAGLWIPAAVNLAGLRQTAWLQNLTVVLKYLPLLFVGVVGWFFVTKANFGAFNASGGSLYSAIGIAAGVALFSFIGVETAAITAKRVKDPRRNVGRASLLGTGAAAVVYLAVSAAVMGLVSHHALVNNGAPFVGAFQAIFPHGAWAGKLVAALAAVSGFGALIGWTLVTAEVSRAPASDGLFPRPFAWTDRNGTAWFGVVVAAALPSLLMLWRYTASSGLTVFTYLVDLTVVTVAIPYLFSACAQLTYLVARRRPVRAWRLARDLSIAVAAALFSLWVTFAAGYSAVYQAMVVVLAGIILYAFVRAHRETHRSGTGARGPGSRGRRRATRRDGHDLQRAVRGGPAPAGHHAPAGPGAVPAHSAEHRRAAVRRRAVGEQGQGRTRRVRRDPARPRRAGALLRAAAGRDPGAARGPGVRAGPGVHPRDPRPCARRPAARAVRGPRRAAAGRVPDRRRAQGRPAAAAGQEPEMGHAAGR